MEDIKKGDLIFVYGTLRKGERADLAKQEKNFGASFIGEDRINGAIYNLGSYPGLKFESDWVKSVFDDESHPVVGEVFRAMDNSLGVLLDSYEGFPYLYNRARVQTEKGRTVWVYVYNGDVSSDQLIPSGDWTCRHDIPEPKGMAA